MDWILLIVPGTIWGESFLFIAEGLEAMGPNGVTFTRILVGYLTRWMFPGSRRSLDPSDWFRAALVSYGFALNIARPVQQRQGALPVIWRAQAVALVLTAPLGLPELLRAH